jgi:hypothetical protein
LEVLTPPEKRSDLDEGRCAPSSARESETRRIRPLVCAASFTIRSYRGSPGQRRRHSAAACIRKLLTQALRSRLSAEHGPLVANREYHPPLQQFCGRSKACPSTALSAVDSRGQNFGDPPSKRGDKRGTTGYCYECNEMYHTFWPRKGESHRPSISAEKSIKANLTYQICKCLIFYGSGSLGDRYAHKWGAVLEAPVVTVMISAIATQQRSRNTSLT